MSLLNDPSFPNFIKRVDINSIMIDDWLIFECEQL